MSLLKKAIHARLNGEVPKPADPDFETLRRCHVRGRVAEDGTVEITPTGDAEKDADNRYALEHFDELPDAAALLQCDLYMKWYEASRKAAVAKAAKSKSKSKKKHEGLEGVRERYV